jgi:hypothetical protein
MAGWVFMLPSIHYDHHFQCLFKSKLYTKVVPLQHPPPPPLLTLCDCV